MIFMLSILWPFIFWNVISNFSQLNQILSFENRNCNFCESLKLSALKSIK
jgi:hypothetical protein